MTQSPEVLLVLLRLGIGRKTDVSLDFSNCDWKSVETLAIKQGVLPILFDGYQKLYKHCGVDAPVEVKLRWYAAAQQAEKHYAKHLQAIKTLSGYLGEHGIRTMVLKGHSLSLCYPTPSHRPCGDIDIYQFGDFKKADDLIEKSTGIKIDRSHHHHTVYVWNGVTVENHYDFVNVHAHKSSAWLEREFKKLAENSCEISDGVYIPSPNLHALFLLRHAGAHFAGEKIMLRHLLDWHLFCERYGDMVDWNYIEDCAEKAGCYKFLICLRICCKRFVGESYENDETAERMWNDILHPEFDKKEPRSWKRFPFKAYRWWSNRWKHKIVYKESLAEQILSLVYSHMINPKI